MDESEIPPSSAAAAGKKAVAPSLAEPSPRPPAPENIASAMPVSAPAAPAPAARLAPRPAAWTKKEAGEWIPPGLAAHLGPELAGFEYEDDYTREETLLPGWRALGATRRGRSHAHRGAHREDAFAWTAAGGFSVLCVSDGAGSAACSRVGSELTVRTVVGRLREKLSAREAELAGLEFKALGEAVGVLMIEAIWAAITRLHELAAASARPPKDFFCTLLLAVHRAGPKSAALLLSQVGDGFFAVLDKDGSARRQGQSDSGSYSGEVHCFVPENEALERAKHIMLLDASRVEAVMLCTDGIEDAFYPLERHAANIFRQLYLGVAEKLPGFDLQPLHGPVIGDARAGQRLEDWLQFEKRGENDDRSILILCRDPANPPADIRPFQPPAPAAEPLPPASAPAAPSDAPAPTPGP